MFLTKISYTLADEYTFECHPIDVARQLSSEDVLERLAQLFATRGIPQFICSDDGPEFTADAVRSWLARLDVKTLYIEPGSPWGTATWSPLTASYGKSFWIARSCIRCMRRKY